MIARLAVVVPARDERTLIGACLGSIARAARRVGLPVEVVVAADACRDDTAAIARAFGAHVVELDAGNVGAARAAGTGLALRLGADWIAGTDADSVVPARWLTVQRALADEGADVILGTVRPRFGELSALQIRAWRATHGGGRALGNIYGANLGIRATTYVASGGFRPLPAHEDRDLVTRLPDSTRVVSSSAAEVVTSARRWGRAPDGYARYLREELADPAIRSASPAG